jgi:hypothetical protein
MGKQTKDRSPQSQSAAQVGTVSAQCEALLSEIATRLRDVYAIGLATEMALRKQNAERDVDLADSIRAGVCTPAWDLSEMIRSAMGKQRSRHRPQR